MHAVQYILNNSFEKLKRYFIKKRVSVPITVLVHLLQSFKAWPMDFRKISFRNKKNLSLLTGNVFSWVTYRNGNRLCSVDTFFIGYMQEGKTVIYECLWFLKVSSRNGRPFFLINDYGF